jgi:hypothetical protein
MTLVFKRKPRSMLSALPDIIDRAALFHPSWFDAWMLWVLAASLVTLVPLLLTLGLWRAEASGELDRG